MHNNVTLTKISHQTWKELIDQKKKKKIGTQGQAVRDCIKPEKQSSLDTRTFEM